MKSSLTVVFLVVLGAVPLIAVAQSDTAATAYAYVTYFECDPANEFRADEIVAHSFAPHYNSALEEGEILSWSWLGHFVGGKYRRALVLTARQMDQLLFAAGALGEVIEEQTPEAGRVFTEVCPVHEDYIWETVPGVNAAVGEHRGKVGFSVYMDCDVNGEERADELMRDVFGPIYDAQIAAGGLTTWSWLAHNVGGKWRRLLSLTSTDHNTMMRARAAILADMRAGRTARSFNQLNDICPDHQDYMWDIRIENP